MNIAFFGSPYFVIPILDHVHKKHQVKLVVSQPDKPVGRNKTITPTPVKQYAIENYISVVTPHTLDGFSITTIDIAIVAAYGLIIPQRVLNQPKYGFINVHYSLLPKYRGASPVQAAILNGDTVTGTSIMQMDEELDHGQILSQASIPITIHDTTEILLDKLTIESCVLLSRVLNDIKHNVPITKLTQNHNQATYTSRLTKQDSYIKFADIKDALSGKNTMAIHNKIRAYFPWPIVWTTLPSGKRCRVISSDLSVTPAEGKISSKIKVPNSPSSLGDNNVKLIIKEIQIEGKQRSRDTSLINQLFTHTSR